MVRFSRFKRWMTALGAVVLAQGLFSANASAQTDFPKQPIRLLVGFPAGGTTDVLARMVAEKLSAALKQPVVVENQPGASGMLATGNVAKARPDGYTLLFASSTHAIYKELYRNVRFDPVESFSPVGLVATTPYVMVVHPSLPVKTVAELISYAKKHPGQINYAGSSPGTAQHLGWERLKRMSGADMQYIPYKGSTDVVADLRTGRLQAAIDNVAVMRQHIQAGYVRALAVTSRKPSSVLPGVPTVAESGLAGFEAVGWFGVFAPAGTPKAVLDTLSGNLQGAMRADGLRNQFATLGAEPQSGSAQDLKKLLADEIRVWSEIIRSANITAQ